MEGHQLIPESGREERAKPLNVALSKDSQKKPNSRLSAQDLSSEGWNFYPSHPFGSTGSTEAPSWIRPCDASPRMCFPQGWEAEPGSAVSCSCSAKFPEGRRAGVPRGMNEQRTGSGASPALPWVQLGTREHPMGDRDELTTNRAAPGAKGEGEEREISLE